MQILVMWTLKEFMSEASGISQQFRDDLNRTMHLAAAAKAMKSIEQHEANLKARQTHGAHNILTSVHFCMAASTHYGIKEQSNERT